MTTSIGAAVLVSALFVASGALAQGMLWTSQPTK